VWFERAQAVRVRVSVRPAGARAHAVENVALPSAATSPPTNGRRPGPTWSLSCRGVSTPACLDALLNDSRQPVPPQRPLSMAAVTKDPGHHRV